MHTLQGVRSKVRVEIIGTAGAGKTTLLEALSETSSQVQAIFHYGTARAAPYYLSAAWSLAPMYARGCYRGERYSAQELKWMMRVGASYKLARLQKVERGVVTVIDQGPIYTLARLLDRQCTSTKRPEFMQWWKASLAQAASVLDLVIWLDAPVDILLQRIYAREKQHAAKAMGEPEARALLMNMQMLYRETMGRLKNLASTKVVTWDTSAASIEEIVEQTMRTLTHEREQPGVQSRA